MVARVGIDLSEFGDVVAAPFEFAANIASNALPDFVREGIENVAEKAGDFAKTPYGSQVFSLLAGSAYLALTPITGPAIVNLTMAAPGLIAGEDFTTAWTKGAIDALQKLAAVVATLPAGGVAALGLGKGGALLAVRTVALPATSAAMAGSWAMSDDIDKTLKDPDFQAFMNGISDEAKKTGVTPAQVMARLGITAESIGKRFGVRPDVAAIATNAAVHQIVFDPAVFDPLTGQRPAPIFLYPGTSETGTLGLLEAIYNRVPDQDNLDRLNRERARIEAAKVRAAEAAKDADASRVAILQYERFVAQKVAAGKAQLESDIAIAQARRRTAPLTRDLVQKIIVAGALVSPAVLALLLVPRRP